MERVTSVPSKQVPIAASSSPELQPAAIIHLPNVTVTREDIEAKIAWFEQVDDVFHRAFLQVALVYRPLDACDQNSFLRSSRVSAPENCGVLTLLAPRKLYQKDPILFNLNICTKSGVYTKTPMMHSIFPQSSPTTIRAC